MTPMQFMARLAALVPPPRHPLVRFYGVWAPHSQWRSRVVPAASKKKRPACSDRVDPSCAAAGTESVPVSSSETAPPHEPSGVQCQPEQLLPSSRPSTHSAATPTRTAAAPLAPPHELAEELRFARLSRIAWATLYQRVFDIDPLQCSSCGGRLRFVEVIEDVGRARSELRRRGLPADPPPLSRARSPDWAD